MPDECVIALGKHKRPQNQTQQCEAHDHAVDHTQPGPAPECRPARAAINGAGGHQRVDGDCQDGRYAGYLNDQHGKPEGMQMQGKYQVLGPAHVATEVDNLEQGGEQRQQ